jgi:hypothetical protein
LRVFPSLVLLVAVCAPLRGQSTEGMRLGEVFAPLHLVGGIEDDRLRTRQLLGSAGTEGYLIRSPSSLSRQLPGDPERLRWALVSPELRSVWNSTIPYSLNEGALWAGRGWSLQALLGIQAQWRIVSLTFAPQLIRVQNSDFLTIPSTRRTHSSLLPPWYVDHPSADLPVRPGNLPYRLFDLGQSTLSVEAGPAVVGGSTENQWWGPGIRNAIVMSNNAAGFPHLFVRTRQPVTTRIGQFEAKWLVGGLTESLYFDTIPDNDIRSLSAMVVTYRPPAEPGLTVGLARAVYRTVGGGSSVPARFHDVLTHWEAAPLAQAEQEDPAEQLLSLFGRWTFPESGFEAYLEWARVALPDSFRDLLTMPHHTQGYTIGLQWARPVHASAHVRVQAEMTYLEQSSTYRQRPTPLFYASGGVPQGYTHRGQVLGAAIGPGASSQWAGVDYEAAAWQLGLFGGRIRWDNDAYYRQWTGRSEVAHDVSVLGGIRGALEIPGLRVAAELTRMQRYNFLYQNLLHGFTGFGAVDPANTTLSLTVSPFR